MHSAMSLAGDSLVMIVNWGSTDSASIPSFSLDGDRTHISSVVGQYTHLPLIPFYGILVFVVLH